MTILSAHRWYRACHSFRNRSLAPFSNKTSKSSHRLCSPSFKLDLLSQEVQERPFYHPVEYRPHPVSALLTCGGQGCLSVWGRLTFPAFSLGYNGGRSMNIPPQLRLPTAILNLPDRPHWHSMGFVTRRHWGDRSLQRRDDSCG